MTVETIYIPVPLWMRPWWWDCGYAVPCYWVSWIKTVISLTPTATDSNPIILENHS